MLKIVVSGCNGYMGRVIASIAAGDPEVEITAGIDIDTSAEAAQSAGFPVFASPGQLMESLGSRARDIDAVIDFSAPAALEGLLESFVPVNIPLVLCTTGYSPQQIKAIEEASVKIPMFRSGNMSVGINLLIELIKRACTVLGEGFDVEIVERHHKRKVDAPSGTALMLADAARDALPYDAQYVYERESVRKARSKNEIGISSVRGGTIVGVHDVILAGQDEVIELRHTAASRDVFAVGAIRAAKFIAGKPAGMYDMPKVLSG